MRSAQDHTSNSDQADVARTTAGRSSERRQEPRLQGHRYGVRAAMGTARYALYFTPEFGSPWWALGAHWLGRCPVSNCAQQQPPVAGISRDSFAALTATPRRYGFHATLKAPMRLAEPYSLDLLCRRLSQFALGYRPFALPALQVALLEDFLALVPGESVPELLALAERLVVELDEFRAPLNVDDRARYAKRSLSDRQRALLSEWGYPHVFDQFRVHFTLTGSLVATSARERLAVQDAARAQLERVAGIPLVFDAVSLFREASPGEPFRLIGRFPLGVANSS